MATPRFDFNFEDGVPQGGPLSSEQLAQQEEMLNPDNIISDHQTRQTSAAEKVQALKMQRLKEENDRLLALANNAAEQNSELAKNQAFLSGQIETLKATVAPQDPASVFEEEELATFGHSKNFVSKVAKLEMNEGMSALERKLRDEYDQKLSALEARHQQALAASTQMLNNVQGTIKNNFEAEVRQAVSSMGLDYGALLAGDDRFLAYAAQPLAVGSNKMWGTQLEENIDNQELQATIAMFAQYAKHVQGSAPTGINQEVQELPQSSGARPLSPQVQGNLEKRQQLMDEATRLQDMFLAGTYPGSAEEYQIEKGKLLSQADDIPISV